MQKKLPSYQWYPGDWRKDPAVQSCSLAARGLWRELLDLMHESGERGRLVLPSGKPPTDAQLARLVGSAAAEVAELVAELEAAGVFDRDESGAICNRRMIRDEAARAARGGAGKGGGITSERARELAAKRWGRKADADAGCGAGADAECDAAGCGSSSSSSSSPSGKKDTPQPPKGGEGKKADLPPIPAVLDTAEFRAAWADWLEHRRQRKPKVTPLSAKEQFAEMVGWGPARAVAAVRHSIAKGYQGIFESRGPAADGRLPRPFSPPPAPAGVLLRPDLTPAVGVSDERADQLCGMWADDGEPALAAAGGEGGDL